jgi:hypothetical protein
MSKKIKTGGVAFPSGESYYDGAGNLRGKNSLHEGMTLRDYFAAKAMQGLLSNSETNRAWGVNENAKYAYEQADAMLKARGEL